MYRYSRLLLLLVLVSPFTTLLVVRAFVKPSSLLRSKPFDRLSDVSLNAANKQSGREFACTINNLPQTANKQRKTSAAMERELTATRGSQRSQSDSQEELPPFLPKLVVFDLDATLWTPELYEMRGGRYRLASKRRVVDSSGEEIRLFPDVVSILEEVMTHPAFQETQMALASRTNHPDWAAQVMKLMSLHDGLTMEDAFQPHTRMIFPGNKLKHFRQLQAATGVAYKDMLFFDDWSQNCLDVGSLGVSCVEVSSRGLTMASWRKGLRLFASRAVKSPTSVSR